MSIFYNGGIFAILKSNLMQTIVAPKKRKIWHDKWPVKYPYGKKALLKAIKKASKAAIFELEVSEDNRVLIKK